MSILPVAYGLGLIIQHEEVPWDRIDALAAKLAQPHVAFWRGAIRRRRRR